MSRIQGAILQAGTAYAAGHQAPMVDLKYGGQMGYSNDLTEWVSNQQYIRRNLICLLVEAPRGFEYLPNKDYWVSTLRSLVELHAISIEGLNATLTVDTVDTPVGGAGQQQSDFTNVTEQVSNPTFQWNEKYGMPITNFLRGWITNLLMDPNSKFAGIATLGARPADMLADMYSATMLFMEPDPTHTKVVKSWLVTNMYPKSSGDVTGKRDITQAGEQSMLNIEFTGIAQFGLGVDVFAQRMLDGINITGANPHLRPAFVQDIAADVAAASKGYKAGVKTLADSHIKV